MTYIDYLHQAFRERLETLSWMDDTTRSQALTKLSQLNVEIGYPSRWHDYSALQLTPEDLVGNLNRIQKCFDFSPCAS